jgi:hypothetical protein
MKTSKTGYILTTLVCVLFASELAANGQTSAITYQGRLTDGGVPAEGLYDMQFALFDELSGGSPLGLVLVDDVNVSEGLFTVQLDFGSSVFDGSELWLQIGVTTNGGPGYALLSPRQQITAAPYAIKAGNAGTLLGSVPADFASDVHSHSGGDITSGTVGESYVDSLIARDSELTWGNLTGIPADLADGDQVGIIAESDPQVGSIGTGYVPKWNGSALVTGSIYDNGNIGIGTGGAPLDKLEVAGDISANSTASGGVVFRFRKDDAQNWAIMTAPWLNSNDSLWFRNETGPVNVMAFDKTSSNVGIHTTDPQATLHVAGDLRVDGTTTLEGNLAFANVQTGYVSVAAGAFHPASNATGWNNDGQWIYPAVNVNNHFYTGVSLPHGATVVQVDWRYLIAAGEGVGVELKLERRGLDGTGNATLATLSESAAGSGVLTETTISSATVDNSQHAYYLHVYTYEAGGDVQSGTVRITYTYSSF